MEKDQEGQFSPVPVLLCATSVHLPALQQVFNNKRLFSITGECKDASNLIKLLQQVDDHYQVLLLLDSEVAMRSNGQLLTQLYRKFPGLRVVIALNNPYTLQDIMKFCLLGYNYFVRQHWLCESGWRLNFIDWQDYHEHSEHTRLYKWLEDIMGLIVFDYLSARYLQLLMHNKTRAQIEFLMEMGEDQLDVLSKELSGNLSELRLIEENLRSGVGVKLSAAPARIVIFRHGHKKVFQHVDNINKIVAHNDYVYVYDLNNRISVRYSNTLKELEEEFADTCIVRVNNYTMININCIKDAEGDSILMNQADDKDKEITLSPLYGPLFFKKFGRRSQPI